VSKDLVLLAIRAGKQKQIEKENLSPRLGKLPT